MSRPFQLDSEIWPGVVEAFAVALGLDEEEVEPHARLISDLGAESLDFLDIVFRLERTFDIKIPRGGIESTARDDMDGEYEVDGVLTAAGLAKLAEHMPEVPAEEFHEGLRVSEIPDMFRVTTFYNIVVVLLELKAQSAIEPMDVRSEERAVG
jgi:acyl carrier protein